MMTIGHSNRSIEEFIGILKAHGVDLVVDVRTIPRSRHNPQFNRESLPGALAAAGIGYRHAPGLGGLRHPRKDSPNTGWRNSGFRGYADYMRTPEFEASLAELERLEPGNRPAIMCAESVPWRCHRLLIADALLVRGVPVCHLMSAGTRTPHRLTSFARVEGMAVSYPSAAAGLSAGETDRSG
jgi:uncharacterized protein (DUF488 family)